MNKLIIAANLGRVRVLRVREPGDDPVEQRHLVELPAEAFQGHVDAIHDAVTDQSGRFRQGVGAGVRGGMSFGEEYELKAEIERKAIKRIAGHIDRILDKEGHPHWLLAAPQPILARLLEVLSKPTIDRLGQTIGSDLTNCPLVEMEERFAKP